MSRGAVPVTVLAAALSLGGCVYYNGLYNAERLFERAERARLSGRDSTAAAAYREVAEKAGDSYRREPDGGWADDALYLLGRAQLRQGDRARARATLSEARRTADDEGVRLGSALYLGVLAVQEGDVSGAVPLLHEALSELPDGPLRAEGHLWRARLLMSVGHAEAGWWDLDRAAEADERLRVEAHLERVAWALLGDDRERAGSGVRGLLSDPAGASREDTLRALVRRAELLWGPGSAAALLATADRAPWPPAVRDGILLERARLKAEDGDTAGAVADLRTVAAGVGPRAPDARLALARRVLERAESVEELGAVRPVLLPALADGRVAGMLEAVRSVELLARRARGDGPPLALFAAGEIARDALGARRLSAALFVEYAARASHEPWAGKALLAAMDVSPDGAQRRRLAPRLESMIHNPYVALSRRARVDPEAFEALERELQAALDRLLGEVTAQARSVDVLMRERSDTLPPG